MYIGSVYIYSQSDFPQYTWAFFKIKCHVRVLMETKTHRRQSELNCWAANNKRQNCWVAENIFCSDVSPWMYYTKSRLPKITKSLDGSKARISCLFHHSAETLHYCVSCSATRVHCTFTGDSLMCSHKRHQLQS